MSPGFAFASSRHCCSPLGAILDQPRPSRRTLATTLRASSARLQESRSATIRDDDGSRAGRRKAMLLLTTTTTTTLLTASTRPSLAQKEPQPETCQLTAAPSGIAFCDALVGDGPSATKGQLIKAHYIGRLENGTVFDSSYSRGRPLTFRVGVGEVIKGWDIGIIGGEGVPPMLAGGKRTLKIPPELGYGTRGAGCKGTSCVIPPDSTLFFDVEFIGST